MFFGSVYRLLAHIWHLFLRNILKVSSISDLLFSIRNFHDVFRQAKLGTPMSPFVDFVSLEAEVNVLLFSFVIYYEKKIIPSVCRLFSLWFVKSGWTCSRWKNLSKPEHVPLENPAENFLSEIRKLFTQSPKQ